ncbi:UvrD-helicase domain-containing protein [Luteolibacter algae]|uniref:DNA 3'-5' helicase n=1 Tax=Luteolibacter algae TaxID=454151 RepID=A0ABW5D4C0_9BACT
MNVLENNLLVLASAGSGKTYTLSDRIIGLMAHGVEPEKIVALTFTRKAAGEFADAILRKLASAAESEEIASELRSKFSQPETDFPGILEKTVRNLPRLTLGTMDGFFAKVVRGFQYELGITGGKFDLLEGEAAESIRDELLEGLIDGELDEAMEERFIEIFRRASYGKESARVLEELRKFISIWHQIFVSPFPREWGLAVLANAAEEDWEKGKGPLLDQLVRDWPNVPDKKKRHESAFEPMVKAFREHTVGSGLLGKATGLVPKILEAVREGDGTIDISYYQPLSITGFAAQALRDLAHLAARSEFAAALSRTRGMHGVISAYDSLIERDLRLKGKLGFDDVKRLMGNWMQGEEARLRREAVDFRLDSSYSHWLLDEFQDTSRDEWNALLPLIDEGITDNDSTVFIVGDKKQAIYAWRGGEVGLFDELTDHYSPGLKTATMATSWRSSPEILELVNKVCGDKQVMFSLFGAAATRWEWEKHVSAPQLARPEKAGYGRVEIVEKDEKTEQVVARLRQLGIGSKKLSCGVLVETNTEVRDWADTLRSEGFQVVEEGAREPAKDHPVGILIWQLLRWLADPSDSFAWNTVRMSPLQDFLEQQYGPAWQKAWESLTAMISESGYAGMIEEITSSLRPTLENFGQRRIADLLHALRELDRSGAASPREAADWISRLKISQSPGVAAVQVMTIHKSKGLGFDVVILPEICSEKIPSLSHFNTIIGENWVSEAPAAWARSLIPELRAAEEKWSEQQTYEAFCKLYVALTRAKRGLYVFIDTPSKTADPQKASLVNWLMDSLLLNGSPGESIEIGHEGWAEEIELLPVSAPRPMLQLGKAEIKRSRSTPSGDKSNDHIPSIVSSYGRSFGSEVHRALESIEWIDLGTQPVLEPEIEKIIDDCLAVPEVACLFTKGDRNVRLYREQGVEAVIDDKWISGVIDRLHVHYDGNHTVTSVEIIDYKTDRVNDAAELRMRYSGQMEAYRKIVASIYPEARVSCILVSTALLTALNV